MRTLGIGIAAAITLAAAVAPANAQGLWVGAPGFGVGIGVGPTPITAVTGAAHIGAPTMATTSTSRAMRTRATDMSRSITTIRTLTCPDDDYVAYSYGPRLRTYAYEVSRQLRLCSAGSLFSATTLTRREFARPVVIPTRTLGAS